MSKNITSFADFLEQTERKPEMAEPTRAESAWDADSASHAEIDAEPVRIVSDAESASHADSARVRGHLRVPNEILYQVLPTLKPSEAIVLLRLYALSHGFQKNTCTVSLDKLASGCNLSRTQTRVCVRSLERKRLIKSQGIDNTNSKKELRGLHFEVKLSPATRAESAPHAEFASHADSAPNKEKTYKENTHTQARPVCGVGVGSKFTIEECRRYAKHLQSTGQGINNPGGYATTIHRTGEADMLIAGFLHPEVADPSSNLDTSRCPDCHGTGMYYPEGLGRGGVKKCKHERLTRQE